MLTTSAVCPHSCVPDAHHRTQSSGWRSSIEVAAVRCGADHRDEIPTLYLSAKISPPRTDRHPVMLNKCRDMLLRVERSGPSDAVNSGRRDSVKRNDGVSKFVPIISAVDRASTAESSQRSAMQRSSVGPCLFPRRSISCLVSRPEVGRRHRSLVRAQHQVPVRIHSPPKPIRGTGPWPTPRSLPNIPT